MNRENIWNGDYIKDFLIQLLLYDDDISEHSFVRTIQDNIVSMLRYLEVDEYYISYLDFEIIKKGDDYFKVIAYNMLTAMWFSGFFVRDCSLLLENNFISLDGVEYRFNEKSKKLTWKEKK